jgi:mono/diheme cytochrome c family protein
VTEIPEHLLKRSKERRAAIGGEGAPDEGAPAAAAEPAADAPAATPVPAAAAATPAEPAPPPPPKPVRPEVAAALGRKKIPYWALPVLLALPLWAYVYQATLEPPPAGEDDPVALGEELYTKCASCHGASGGGGVGPAFDTVLETWPDYRDHLAWVRLGDPGWPAATYGATDKAKATGMPPFDEGQLSEEELAQVVLYERVAFGGLEEGSEEYEALVAIAEGESTFEEAGLGPESTEAGVAPDSVFSAG